MELRINWTDFAKKELKNIFDYYKENAGLNVARKIVIDITRESLKLQKQPNIGQKEELLQDSDLDYRYFLHEHYKVIYCINKNTIDVYDVFDTRQNPKKITRKK